MNYSKILKPKLVGAPYKRKECNSFYLALILVWIYYSKIGYGRATSGVMTQQELKCTPNNQCKCIVSMKTGYAIT